MSDDNTNTFGAHNEHSLSLNSYSLELRNALNALEVLFVSGEHDKILLLVERGQMKDVALIAIERLLRYTSCQHLLFLTKKRVTSTILEEWQHTVLWEAQTPFSAQFRLTTQLQEAEKAQVCITSVFDMQMQHVGVDSTDPFFKGFDVVFLYDVPANPGPRYSQIMDLFANTARVIGVSSALSKEAGETFFGEVIDTTSSSISQV